MAILWFKMRFLSGNGGNRKQMDLGSRIKYTRGIRKGKCPGIACIH